jgi:hypothetical protein
LSSHREKPIAALHSTVYCAKLLLPVASSPAPIFEDRRFCARLLCLGKQPGSFDQPVFAFRFQTWPAFSLELILAAGPRKAAICDHVRKQRVCRFQDPLRQANLADSRAQTTDACESLEVGKDFHFPTANPKA